VAHESCGEGKPPLPTQNAVMIRKRGGERRGSARDRRSRAALRALLLESSPLQCAGTMARVARTDTASRVIAAPPDRVYAALVDSDALTAWLPPDGMSGSLERFDARPGGCYRLKPTYDNPSAAGGQAPPDS